MTDKNVDTDIDSSQVGSNANELELEYVNEEHIKAFAKALSDDPESDQTEHIAAVTDFMPIRQKIRKKKNPKEFEGYSYHLLRYPLMAIIFSIMFFELICYICIRQIVNFWEYFYQWRGISYRLRQKMRNTNNYEEWIKAAEELDIHFKYNEWKKEIPFEYYDYKLLRKVNRDLKSLRQETNEHPQKLKDILQICLKNNYAGVENARLYSHSYYGTKDVVKEYVDEVTESLKFARKTKLLSTKDKLDLFKSSHKNYGRTALCLSGGASFGYYHLGVVKALFEAKLLPSIFTGTSAGGLVASLVCVRTDEELKQVLTPELHTRLTACSDPMSVCIQRWLETGARFDACDWARKLQWITKGSLTFMEAYERTGRILNISVISYDPHSPPKVLNYITSPDCVIWSAVIASSAVPGILNPVVLMQKLKDGSIVPYNYVGRPVTHRCGKGWRGGFLFASIEQFLKLDLNKWLKWIRDLDLLPRIANQDWSSIWLQKFEGNITIWPRASFWDFFYILRDPTYERLEKMIKSGQRVTWPKMYMISNRLRIEREIQKGREQLRRELRKHRYPDSSNQGNDVISDAIGSDDIDKLDELDKHLRAEKVTDIGLDSDFDNENNPLELSSDSTSYSSSLSEEEEEEEEENGGRYDSR